MKEVIKNMYHEIVEIEKALIIIFQDKMISDGYFNASRYIESKEIKESLFKRLSDINSKYANLFHRNSRYPKDEEDIQKTWFESLSFLDSSETNIHKISLEYTEADAIVFWFFSTYKKHEEREKFLLDMLKHFKSLYRISVTAKIERGIIFNQEKINPIFIDDIHDYSKTLNVLTEHADNVLYFRGHSDTNYKLIPSLFRIKGWEKEESKMFNEIMVQCPLHFNNCKTNFERLVEMQHYGIPTRLLDITTNPYVALYFSVVHDVERHGEVVLLKGVEELTHSADSNYVYVLSNLAKLKYQDKKRLMRSDPTSSDDVYSALLSEIKKDIPSFDMNVDQLDLKSYFFVNALMSNDRIRNQDGAFVLCGLISEDIKEYNLNALRLCVDNRNPILFIEKESKKNILKDLDTMFVNEVKLFPGIESTSKYIREKYRNSRTKIKV